MFIYQVLNLVACYLYTLSLEGGDLDFLLNEISYLVTILLMSFSLTVIVGILNIYTCSGSIRIFNFLLQVLIILKTLSIDLGTDLQNHGQYNALIYLLLFIPLAIGFFLWKTCIYIKTKLNNWKQ